MKILYFVQGFPPSIGAAALNSYKIVEFLAKFGHHILVLSPSVFSKTSDFNDFKWAPNSYVHINYSSNLFKVPLNLIFSHFDNLLKYILKLKQKFKADLVLSQYHAYHYASVVGGYTSKIFKIPHVIRSHDIFFPTYTFSLPFKIFHSLIYTKIYHSIFNSDIFYVTTSEMKKYFLHFKKLKNINFKIQYNGIDVNEFFPFKNQEELKDKYGCDTIISFVGQISRDYDLQYIVKILPELLKTYKETHFLIIGSGIYEKNLLKYIQNNNLTNNVHLLGIKPHYEIPYFINNSDIGIGRITHDAIWRYMIPVKCLEYMACMKPFITAPISTDIIKDNDVGLVLKKNFKKRDIFEYLSILIEDKSLRTKLGKNGIEKINQKFRWEKIMKDFNRDLVQLINNI